jgi:hypothetical protein
MPGAVSWTCQETCLTERGTEQESSPTKTQHWHGIMKEYTRRALTYPSDRIHALKGVASEFQKTRDDEFLDKYGVWKNDIHEPSFWMRTRPHHGNDSLPLPSWCWAATGGPKVWIGEDWSLQAMPEATTMDETGSLIVSGQSIMATVALLHAPQELRDDIKENFRHEVFLSLDEGNLSDEDSELSAYLLTTGEPRNIPIGIGTFDAEPVLQARCFFLASKRSRPIKCLWPHGPEY